jgi:glucose-1-phosphate adenylyltransferase
MIEYHRQVTADVTVATIPVERQFAVEFGVVERMADGRIVRFIEKDPEAPTIPGEPDKVLASMGNYVFSTNALLSMLHEDAHDKSSSHDFAKDILPRRLESDRIFAYDFRDNRIPAEPGANSSYWRDVGTVDAYFEANMEIRAANPPLNLYNRSWPLRTASYPDPPARFEAGANGEPGQAHHSLISGGAVIAGYVKDSVLGRNVHVHAGAVVEECVVLDNCEIGAGARVRRTILDKNVRLPAAERIGFDAAIDRQRYHVTEKGIVVVPGKRSPVEVSTIGV